MKFLPLEAGRKSADLQTEEQIRFNKSVPHRIAGFSGGVAFAADVSP
jgi:hypothetical protein